MLARPETPNKQYRQHVQLVTIPYFFGGMHDSAMLEPLKKMLESTPTHQGALRFKDFL